MIDNTVVLAAGRGHRLRHHTGEYPKCLIPVAGRPIIHYILSSLAGAGVRNVVLVLGHNGEQIEASLGDGGQFGLSLRYVWNRDYELGNASSLWRALPAVGSEPFLLVMGDHLCSTSLLRTFLSGVDGRSALAVDRSVLETRRTAEATKVALVDDRVADIGKDLTNWDAVDTGVFYWAAGAFAPIADGPPEGELTAMVARLARSGGGLTAFDVSGHFWLDIDTEDDLRLAERLLGEDEHRLA